MTIALLIKNPGENRAEGVFLFSSRGTKPSGFAGGFTPNARQLLSRSRMLRGQP